MEKISISLIQILLYRIPIGELRAAEMNPFALELGCAMLIPVVYQVIADK